MKQSILKLCLATVAILFFACGSDARTAPKAESDSVYVEVPLQHNFIYEGNGRKSLEVVCHGVGPKVQVRLDLVTDLSLMSKVRDTVMTVTAKVKPGKKGKLKISGLEPGFYQANLSYVANGKTLNIKPFNIGINPEKIVSPQDAKPDFDQFWAETLAELAKVPIDAELTLDPKHSNDDAKSYVVKMKSFGGVTIGGYLCMPVKPGKYPVIIDYLGYGAFPPPYDPAKYTDRIGFLLSVRDQGIFRHGHRNWMHRGLDSKENFYYRGAFCDVVRAIDFVCSLENADTDCILARGESQGGAFTLVSVSLDHRIKAAAPSVPFLGDFRDYYEIVSWPLRGVMEAAAKQGVDKEQVFEMLTYFDVKNFVTRIQCPIYMGFGLQDATCPPHTNFAEYNLIPTEKHWWVAPYGGHETWDNKDWHASRDAWLETYIR